MPSASKPMGAGVPGSTPVFRPDRRWKIDPIRHDAIQVGAPCDEPAVRSIRATIESGVTEAKRAELAPQESERRLATLLANLPDGVSLPAPRTMEFVSEGCFP